MLLASAWFNAPRYPLAATGILLLANMVTDDDLTDPAVVTEIREDVRGEVQKFGTLIQVIIPRSGPFKRLVLLQYANETFAATAASSLQGRKFADRVLGIEYGTPD